tara:strand:+ start:4513 stop:4854 length:342 start_codon:yes stop_codon:yes gene_type:complete
MNSQIEHISTDIAKTYYSNRGDAIVSIDPALVVIVGQIVLEVLRLINSCKETPQSFKGMCSKPTLLQRAIIRRAVKEHLNIDDKSVTKRLSAAIIDRAGSLSVEELETLMSSV